MTIRTSLQLVSLAVSTFNLVAALPTPSQAAISFNDTGAITRSVSNPVQETDLSSALLVSSTVQNIDITTPQRELALGSNLAVVSAPRTSLVDIKSSGETIKLDEPSAGPGGLFMVVASVPVIFALKKTKRPAAV